MTIYKKVNKPEAAMKPGTISDNIIRDINHYTKINTWQLVIAIVLSVLITTIISLTM